MQRTTKKRSTRDLLAKLGLGGAVLALALSAPATFGQQNPPNSDASAPPAQDQQAAPQQEQNANPPQNESAEPQNQNQSQDQQAEPQDQNQQNQGPINPQPSGNPSYSVPQRAVPSTLTLPAGSIIQIRTTDFLSSDGNHKGDQFIATLAQPIVVDGWVVMRRGQTITGQVTDAAKAGRVKGVSKLQLDLSQLTLVDGQLVPVQTQLLNASAGTSNGRDAAAVAITTG